MLRQGLLRARAAGIERALITCDDDNAASIRTIESAGGALEDVVWLGDQVPWKRRYWIDLGSRDFRA